MSTKPLSHIGILMTRPQDQGHGFQEDLERLGGTVYSLPTIQIVDVKDIQPIQKVMVNLKKYRWVLFTSVNGVERFFKFGSPDLLQGIRLGAIGQMTRGAIEKMGLTVDICPEDFRAEGFLSDLIDEDGEALQNGCSILIPRAKEARDVLPQGLREKGAQVDVLTVYETKCSDIDIENIVEKMQKKAIHCITFTSSSTVKCFFEKFCQYDMDQLLDGIAVACIGPVTAQTFRDLAKDPQIISPVYTTSHMARAMGEYFRRRHV